MEHNTNKFEPSLQIEAARSERWTPMSIAALCWRWGRVFLRVALPAVVLALVWRELRGMDWTSARDALARGDPRLIAFGVLATAFTLSAMGCYDVLSFPASGGRGSARAAGSAARGEAAPPRAALSRLQLWRTGALIFAWMNFLTLGPIGGPALRMYFYRKVGMSAAEIASGLSRLYIGMFSGLAGWIIAALLPKIDADSIVIRALFAAGIAVSLSVGVSAALGWKGPLAGSRFSRRRSAALGLIGACDWGGMLLTFFLVGRAVGVEIGWLPTARAIYLGHAAGMASMIPGGLGSADAVWFKMLTLAGAPSELAAAQILLFRFVFYLLPWGVALFSMYALFGGRWKHAARWQRRVLAGASIVSGLLLLLSAATPATGRRLQFIAQRLPIGAIEASHAASVVAAATLLFLARGLVRGYRSAYLIAVVSLAASGAAHTLKGGDYEETIASIVLLVLLVGAHGAFTRRGRIPIGWELALSAGAASLAFFLIAGIGAFGRIPYHRALWTTFAANAEASRFLRGSALLAGVVLVVFLRQAVRPVSHRVSESPDAIDRALRRLRTAPSSANHLLVAAGDKGIWWHRGEAGLVLHQRIGDRMIVFRDPICEPGAETDLLSDLHAYADEEDLDLVFYQISGAWLSPLHDFGYSFFKIGEEASVLIDGFTLTGSANSGFRKTIRRVESTGVRFRLIEPPFEDELIRQLGAVSDEWLLRKHATELQFSVGYFSPSYLRRFPVGVAEQEGGAIVAFTNLLMSSPGTEATCDFMRYRDGGVDNLMEYVLIQTMRSAAERGYPRFNLGMSPLYDVGERQSAPVVERWSRLAFRFGERFYNYKGLHAYKNKFHPVWAPRYMAFAKPWDWPGAVLATTRLIRSGSRESRRRIAAARREADIRE